MLPTPPPRQSSLPSVASRSTSAQTFNEMAMARVEKIDDLATKGKIEVIFLNRTKPAPVWVLEGPSPAVGDFVLIGFINGQKNNPYVAGLFKHRAWTSNFIHVTDKMIRLQFPTDAEDVAGSDTAKESDPTSHLRDESKLPTRAYIQIDASGVKLHVPSGTPITVEADSVLVSDSSGGGTAKPLARQGDPVEVQTDTGPATGTITTGSSRVQST